MSRSDKPLPLSEAVQRLASPSAQDRQRVRAGIDQALASGAVSETVRRVERALEANAPLRAAALGSRFALLRWVLPTLIVGVGAGVFLGRRSAAVPAPALPVAVLAAPAEPLPAATLPPMAAGPESGLSAPEPVPPPRAKQLRAPSEHKRPGHGRDNPSERTPDPPPLPLAPAAPEVAATPHDSHHVAEELRLIRLASAALAAHDEARAARALVEHEQRFPHGDLAQERRALQLIARCQRGEDAQAARDAFLAADASSALAARVRSACGAGR